MKVHNLSFLKIFYLSSYLKLLQRGGLQIFCFNFWTFKFNDFFICLAVVFFHIWINIWLLNECLFVAKNNICLVHSAASNRFGYSIHDWVTPWLYIWNSFSFTLLSIPRPRVYKFTWWFSFLFLNSLQSDSSLMQFCCPPNNWSGDNGGIMIDPCTHHL